MDPLTSDEVAALLEQNEDAQLVAVYSSHYFDTMHLPNSRNIPLRDLARRARDELDPEAPVIVYCSSPQCNMSPQAAELLVDLGFEAVYDYEGGVAAWLRSGRDIVRPEESPEAS